MENNFNELTAAQTERLAILAEECGEVVQIVGKILRHGYDSYHPNHPEIGSNKDRLESELRDISFSISLLLKGGDITEEGLIGRNHDEYFKRKAKYSHHNKDIIEEWNEEYKQAVIRAEHGLLG